MQNRNINPKQRKNKQIWQNYLIEKVKRENKSVYFRRSTKIFYPTNILILNTIQRDTKKYFKIYLVSIKIIRTFASAIER